MTSPRTPDRIREDIRARESEPHGQARVAAAEVLVAEARVAGDRPTLIDAFNHLAASYAFAARSRRLPEPVAAMLRLWDQSRDDFGEDAAFRLHWALRWVVEGLLDDPGAPLTQIEEWSGEMRRRHAEAGHSLRAAHRREFMVAAHTGDEDAAARARTAWLAAARDGMADCHACESAARGDERLAEGDDEEALREWGPALRGEHTCPGPPSDVLARSLLPLTRLGRTDEARLHHIRGHLLVRDEDGARRALAEHLTFCARTGNEARALEILNEQNVRSPQRWHEGDDPRGYGDWMAAVALLARRLTALGHGERPVPGPPGHDWTATTLLEHASDEALAVAERFDHRRGTDVTEAAGEGAGRTGGVVGTDPAVRTVRHAGAGGTDQARSAHLCRSRITAEPLLEHLPLGLGGPALPTRPAPAPAEPADPSALLAEARSLSAVGHPSALAVWARLEDAVARTGTRFTDGQHAELLDHRAMEQVRTDPAGGAAHFTEAAHLYATAGMPGEALACRARAVLAGAFSGQEVRALEDIRPLCEKARRLRDEGRVSTRHATAVLLTRARICVLLLGEAASEEEAAHIGEALDADLAHLVAFAEPDRDEPAVLARIAEATETRGRLAAQCGETERAGELLTDAAAFSRAAGRPWAATGAELTLGRLLTESGEHTRAAALLRETLDDTARAGTHAPGELALLHLALADAYAAGGRTEATEATETTETTENEVKALLHAAHWAARADRSGTGAHARLRLGGRLLDLERLDESEAVLESLLPELLRARNESAAVQACDWLAQTCDRAGRLAEGAEWLLLAADSAHEWEDREAHAAVAHLAADALRGSGQSARALEAYARAEQVWRALGDTHAVVRTFHARGWLAVEARQPADIPLAFMDAAHREIEAALAGGDETDERERLPLRLQTGHTHRQTAEILAASADGADSAQYSQALDHADRAVEAFHACGEAGLHEAADTELSAAALESELGRHDAALARAARVRALYPSGTPDPDGTVAARFEAAERVESRAATARG